MIAFINASPLMYLGKLGLLELLPRLYEKIITCNEVREELMADRSAPENAALDIAFESWLSVEAPVDLDLKAKLLELNIHAGEAGVIALARESKVQDVLVIDDLHARDVATALGIRAIGTLGVMLAMLHRGMITPEAARGL